MYNKNSNPIDHLIEFAWASGADKFWVNNAKDELKRLREKIQKYESLFSYPIAYALINDRGDVYGFRYFINTTPENESSIVPLYSDREGLRRLYDKPSLPSLNTK